MAVITSNVDWPYDVAVQFLGIYPRELKISVQKICCPRTCIAALFIFPNWKQFNIHQQENKVSLKSNITHQYIKKQAASTYSHKHESHRYISCWVKDTTQKLGNV